MVSSSSNEISIALLAEHDGRDGRTLWVAIDGEVFDLSRFKDVHPGGAEVLMAVGGAQERVATDLFLLFHPLQILDRLRPALLVGRLVAGSRRTIAML